METSNIFLKKFRWINCGKKRKKMLEKQKYCKTTLLIESDVERNHFPYSVSEYILKTEQKTSESGIYYELFSLRRQKDRISVTMATASRLLTQINLRVPVKNLYIVATKRSFFPKLLSFMLPKTFQYT